MKVEQKSFWKNMAFIALAVVAVIYFNLNGSVEDRSGQEPTSPQSSFLPEGEYILALSWQPAFCETKPNKPECRTQRQNRFDASNFSLHGLWPQPEHLTYCDASYGRGGQWSRYPGLKLSDGLRRELERKMPGYRSYLHRHEWAKHGSCARGLSAEAYFATSLELLDQINASSLKTYIAENAGGTVTLAEARKRMDRSLGNGAGERLMFFCERDGRRNLVAEIRLSLSGGENDLGSSIAKGTKMDSRCKSGIVDPVGLQ